MNCCSQTGSPLKILLLVLVIIMNAVLYVDALQL